MKTSNSALSHRATFFDANNFRLVQIAAIVLITMSLTSCANLYKIQAAKENTADTITALIKSDKKFIIHFKDTSFIMAGPSISGNELKGRLLPLNEIQERYLHPRSRNKNPYLKVHEYEVLGEVHVYATEKSVADTAQFSLPIAAITKIDINQKNIEATNRSKIIGGLAISSVVAGGIAALAWAAQSALESSLSNINVWGGD